jgi:hypothetical protein
LSDARWLCIVELNRLALLFFALRYAPFAFAALLKQLRHR